MTTIHEVQQILWVTTPLGDGIVLFVIDMGAHENCILLVGLEDGKLKHFTTEQVRLCRNDTLGINTKGHEQ